MIYIFEILTDDEKKHLEYLEPFIDFRYDFKNKMYWWQTYCSGFKKVDGKKEEIRKIRVYKLEQARQGFTVDDFVEARMLSMYLSGDLDEEESFENKYSDILPYLEAKGDNSFIDLLFVPAVEYIRFYENTSPSKLELIDMEALYKESF
jgi:hypothetical protein